MEIIIFISAVGNKSSEIISETVKNRNWKVNGKWKFAVYFGGGGGGVCRIFFKPAVRKDRFHIQLQTQFQILKICGV